MNGIKNIGSIPSVEIKVCSDKSINIRNNHRLEFNKCLENLISKDFKISTHASERLNNRNINLTKIDIENINTAIDKMEKKGSKESLILYKDLALIASIKNRTIITAIDKNSMDEKIFTNIDGAIII